MAFLGQSESSGSVLNVCWVLRFMGTYEHADKIKLGSRSGTVVLLLHSGHNFRYLVRSGTYCPVPPYHGVGLVFML